MRREGNHVRQRSAMQHHHWRSTVYDGDGEDVLACVTFNLEKARRLRSAKATACRGENADHVIRRATSRPTIRTRSVCRADDKSD